MDISRARFSGYAFLTLAVTLFNIYFVRTYLVDQWNNKTSVTVDNVNCRSLHYPFLNNTVKRLQFSDNFVPWNVEWSDYNPDDFTASIISGKPWADKDISDPTFSPKWNGIDGHVNRKSFMGEYTVKDKRPLNPAGRTGLSGRGLLGRWGPNHAAVPIVSRWKRNSQWDVVIDRTSQKRILQFVAIRQRGTGAWAIPGGMVDPGEAVNVTLKREFLEEACNSLQNPNSLEEHKEIIDLLFDKGEFVYEGYVDDSRNTDNAWIETVVMHFHDDDGNTTALIPLQAGDDAVSVCWMDIDREFQLIAVHSNFISRVAAKYGAHW